MSIVIHVEEMALEMIKSLEDCISRCFLPEFSRTYDGSKYCPEFKLRENNLKQNFRKILNLLENVDLNNNSSISVVSLLVILDLELQSEKSLSKNTKSGEYSQIINGAFTKKYGITLEKVLRTDNFKTQEIFDSCLKFLYQKLVHGNFMKYPGLVYVYYNLFVNAEELKVTMNSLSVLPISLILIDYFSIDKKLKGLQCCSSILNCLSPSDFKDGNYYEVIYRSLKKNIVEKDLETTKVLLKCFLSVIEIFPQHHKNNLLDDMFSIVLDQLHTESNLYRKADCFAFVTKIIYLHKVNCVKKRICKIVISDNLDICTDSAVSEILLEPVIECLQMWVKYCWCTWRLSSDQKLLSSLFKILYTTKEDSTRTKVQDIIITLILLCKKDEQQQLIDTLENIPHSKNVIFIKSIQTIKENIKSYLFFLFLVTRRYSALLKSKLSVNKDLKFD